MGESKVRFSKKFADDLADLVYFIESKGMPQTAQKYVNKVYNFIHRLQYDKVEFAYCNDVARSLSGLKCIKFNTKYTLVFYQFPNEVIFMEFIPSKLLRK